MKKQKLTDKQKLQIIIGKITVNIMKFMIFEATMITFGVWAFNSMTVYR